MEDNETYEDKVVKSATVFEYSKGECLLLRKENSELQQRIDKTFNLINSKFIFQGALTSYEVNDLLNEILECLIGR